MSDLEKHRLVNVSYYNRNKEFVLNRHKENRDNYRKKVLDTLGGVCVMCGYSDYRALQIDHINGNGKKDRNGKVFGFYEKVINDKDNNYQLLCANCNAIKRIENKEFGLRFTNYGK